ncbi:hypothetical protein [Chitinophaga barathri]|uniref:Uncharacterized protein n=1 Tax=Chitinophaga barathri TaxID=1647451 RepID=A0A3N4MA08_9BACT|nr:hypothetical protein [Chitinophaga barathri]RPD38187.1 hypothetical protein EG028_26370 [Chitinophaga barathri]
MRTDLFRFVSKRSVQRMPKDNEKQQLITLFPPGQSPALAHEAPITRAAAAEVVKIFLDDNEDPKDIKELNLITPIYQVDQALLKCNNRLRAETIGETVKKETNLRLKDLVKLDSFKSELTQLSNLLWGVVSTPSSREAFRELLLRARYIFSLLEKLAEAEKVTGNNVSYSVDADYVFNFLTQGIMVLPRLENAPGNALSRQPSMGDLRVVKEEWVSYELGEVAHIENALRGESRERTHKLSSTREETVFVETETEVTTQRDLETTDRFEMQSEVSRTLAEDADMSIGASVTASYGVIKEATATFDYATSTSREESNKTSSQYAKEITARSSERVNERIKEQRTVRTVVTMEENNRHTIDNSRGDRHVTGIYRWVNKKYKAQVFDYGKRMLLEFIVPEPAAFLKKAVNGKFDNPEIPEHIQKKKPVFPGPDFQPSSITRGNYLELSKQYGPQLDAPQPELVTVSKALHLSDEENKDFVRNFVSNNELTIPAEYEGRRFWATYLCWTHTENGGYFALSVGNQWINKQVTGDGDAEGHLGIFDFGEVQTQSVPVSIRCESLYGYTCNIVIECVLRKEQLEKWQLAAYAKIMDHLNKQQLQYEQEVREFLATTGMEKIIAVQGKNPADNRITERTELKRSVIAMLQQHYFDQPPFNQQAVTNGKINFDVARMERDHIQWFEQAFEWQNLTFALYPYFYNDAAEWPKILTAEGHQDPKFGAFLDAGAARVVVPVRSNFEKAMAFYLATGIIWKGGQVPQVNDPLYLSIVQEIQEQTEGGAEGTPVDEPWEYSLPTSLVMLQPDATLPRNTQN